MLDTKPHSHYPKPPTAATRKVQTPMRSTLHPQPSTPYPTPSPAGAITATEQRAFNNLGITRLFGAPIGLTGFGPNINLARDPRFGRVSREP